LVYRLGHPAAQEAAQFEVAAGKPLHLGVAGGFENVHEPCRLLQRAFDFEQLVPQGGDVTEL
jgi:hypothetical protein